MKMIFSCLLILLFVTITAFTFQPSRFLKDQEDAGTILKDIRHYLYYMQANVNLDRDFLSFDKTGKPISKMNFLTKLLSGKFMPLKIKTTNNQLVYKLYQLKLPKDKVIGEIIKAYTLSNYEHYKMEGTTFPKFNYVDLNNNNYTSANTRGKIVILKTWFIGCHNCVAEIPELNKLVRKYEHRQDVVFISLALDKKVKLQSFLKKTIFYYPVVPVHMAYVSHVLKTNSYPTHFIINKHGRIVKVVNSADELSWALDKEAAM